MLSLSHLQPQLRQLKVIFIRSTYTGVFSCPTTIYSMNVIWDVSLTISLMTQPGVGICPAPAGFWLLWLHTSSLLDARATFPPPPMVSLVWAAGESRYLDSTKIPAYFNTWLVLPKVLVGFGTLDPCSGAWLTDPRHKALCILTWYLNNFTGSKICCSKHLPTFTQFNSIQFNSWIDSLAWYFMEREMKLRESTDFFP